MKKNLESEFPLSEGIIYLNHAAVAPWPQRTSEAVIAFARENSQQGSNNYLTWLKKEVQLRQQLKQLLNAHSSDDIALVKNTSEALSFVAYGLDWEAGDNIVSSNEEFPSNRIPWQSLSAQQVEFRQAELSKNDDPEQALFQQVDNRTRLITVSSIQFASGLRLDLERIGQFCQQRNILFCIDAIQSLGAVRFDVQACHADFVMADGHKWMLSPEGLGVFYTSPKARDQLKLTQFGWHMIEELNQYENKPWTISKTARRFECGSPNMLAIHALSASLSLLLETGMGIVEKLVLEKNAYLADQIEHNPLLTLLSKRAAPPQSGITVFKHNTIALEPLFEYLKNKGVVCAMRGGGIRFSPHFYTPQSQLEKTLALLKSL